MGKKWSESRPAEKMLSLYTLLLTSSQPVRLTELSRLLNCAKQSVTRLIDQLESSHFGKIVRHQLGRQVAYSLDRPRHRPCTSLDAEGLRQLVGHIEEIHISNKSYHLLQFHIYCKTF